MSDSKNLTSVCPEDNDEKALYEQVEAALLAFFIAEDEHTDEEIEAKRIAFSRMNPEDNTSDGSGEDE